MNTSNLNFYEILGISEDASNYEINQAIIELENKAEKNNGVVEVTIDNQPVTLRRDQYIKVSNAIKRWYSSRIKEMIIVMDNKRTCEILGIAETSDEDLEGILRFISKGTFSTKRKCDMLCDAIYSGNEELVDKMLNSENDDKLNSNQIMAIYRYAVNETVKNRNAHASLWNKLMREKCILTGCIERELSSYNNKKNR